MSKLIFGNYEVVITTNDRFIEGESINIKYYECLRAREKGRSLSRKVRYDNEAGDLYIKVDGKKYFYSEFK